MVDELLQQAGEANTVVLSAGNLFGPVQGRIWTQKARLILSAYQQMDYAAIAVGYRDLKMGIETMDAFFRESAIPVICANLVDSRGKPHYQSQVLLDRGGEKILALSVIDPSLWPAADGLRLADPVKAARQVIVQHPADFVLLVVHAANEAAAAAILEGVGPVDLAVLGGVSGVIYPATSVGGSLLVANNIQGRSVAWLDFSRGSGQKRLVAGSGGTTVLDEHSIAPDEALEKDVQALVALENQPAGVPMGGQSALRGDQAIYLGQSWCVRCHGDIVSDWKKTAHARAMQRLSTETKDKDPACFKCHVTGPVSQANGHAGEMALFGLSSRLYGVQCEACHGPGSLHQTDPEKNRLKLPDEALCRNCHTAERDPNFAYAKALRKVQHRGSPQ